MSESAKTALRLALESGELIVVAGPLISRQAELPGLEQVAAELVSSARGEDADCDSRELARMLDDQLVAEVLDRLRDVFGPEDFQRRIERRLACHGRPPPPLANAVASLRDHLRAIYTVNLDRLVERTLGGGWAIYDKPRADLAQRNNLLFYVRGMVARPQHWVLTREQERREFAVGAARRQILQTAYLAHHILFVGFDAEARSLWQLIDLLPANAPEETPAHFILLSECNKEQRRRLSARGLEVIVGDAAVLLAELGGSRGAGPARGHVSLCPYPGLAPFTGLLADDFYGRTAEVSEAASRLGDHHGQHRRWLAVTGASGVGKSSFVHAGVVPALQNGCATNTPARWIVATMRPGPNPLHNLAGEIAGLVGAREQSSGLLARFERSARSLAEFLRDNAPPNAAVALIVDQLEELVTTSDAHERSRFGELVAHALLSERLYLITTVRPDFESQVQEQAPELYAHINDLAEVYALAPITAVGLRDAICEPAVRAGVGVEAELVEQILADASSGPRSTSVGALPLVAHVLRALWDARPAEDAELTLADYKRVGRIAGAISKSADRLVQALDEQHRPCARTLLMQLVSVRRGERDRIRTISKHAAIEAAGGGERGLAVLNHLSGLRTGEHEGLPVPLITVRQEDQTARVDLIHEALLWDWTTLRSWVDDERRQRELDDELERAASRWSEQHEPKLWLPTGETLTELLAGRPEPGTVAQRYRTLLSRRRGARRFSAAGALVLLFCALVMLDSWREEVDQTTDRLDNLQTVHAALAAERLSQDPELAIDALELALQTAGQYPELGEAPGEVSQALFQTLSRAHSRRALEGVGDVFALELGPDEILVAAGTVTGEVGVWSTSSGRRLWSDPGHDALVLDFAFSPDGAVLYSAGGDRQVRAWRVATGEQVWSSGDLGYEVVELYLVADSARLVALAFTPTLRLQSSVASQSRSLVESKVLDLRTGGPIGSWNQQVSQMAGFVHNASASPDGRWLALATMTGRVDLFVTAADSQNAQEFLISDESVDNERGGEDIISIAWSPDSAQFGVLLDHGGVSIFDVATGRRTRVSSNSRGMDMRGALTWTGADEVLTVWNERTQRHGVDGVIRAEGHFDGEVLALGHLDAHTVWLLSERGDYSLIHLNPIATDISPVERYSVARHRMLRLANLSFGGFAQRVFQLSKYGEFLVTPSRDGAEIISLATAQPAARFHGIDGRASLSPDGTRLVIRGREELEVREPSTGEVLARLPVAGSGGYAHDTLFSPSGSWLAVMERSSSHRREASLWNTNTWTRAEWALPDDEGIVDFVDDTLVVTSNRKRTSVRDVATGNALHISERRGDRTYHAGRYLLRRVGDRLMIDDLVEARVTGDIRVPWAEARVELSRSAIVGLWSPGEHAEFWNMKSRELVARIDGPVDKIMLADSGRVAALHRPNAQVDIVALETLETQTVEAVQLMAISPSGRVAVLLPAIGDELWILDVAHNQLRARLPRYRSVLMTPDDRYVITSVDGFFFDVWAIDPALWLMAGCDLLRAVGRTPPARPCGWLGAR